MCTFNCPNQKYSTKIPSKLPTTSGWVRFYDHPLVTPKRPHSLEKLLQSITYFHEYFTKIHFIIIFWDYLYCIVGDRTFMCERKRKQHTTKPTPQLEHSCSYANSIEVCALSATGNSCYMLQKNEWCYSEYLIERSLSIGVRGGGGG